MVRHIIAEPELTEVTPHCGHEHAGVRGGLSDQAAAIRKQVHGEMSEWPSRSLRRQRPQGGHEHAGVRGGLKD